MKQKLLSLISGGIDSPVASYLMHKRFRGKASIEFIFFYSDPYMPLQNKQAAESMVSQLKKIMKTKTAILYVVPYAQPLKAIATQCPSNLRCILCRRMMFRIASEIAQKQKCTALVTGENLAQVASQTLPNMILSHQASALPVLTPLLGADKNETIKTARKIQTFDLAKEHTCCGLVPKSPRTNGKQAEIEQAEKNLDINKIVKQAVNSVKLIRI